MTLAQAQLCKQDSLILTKRRTRECPHEKCEDNSMSAPMDEKKTCTKQPSSAPPRLLECDSISLAKKRTPDCLHKHDDGSSSPMMKDSSSKSNSANLNDISDPPLVRKKSLNSLFKEVSLKHNIPESELDKPVLKQQDSVLLTKRRSPRCVHENHSDSGICPKPPTLMELDSIALARKRAPKCIHSK